MMSGRCLWEMGVGSGLLAAEVGPSRMRPIISLHDFGDLGVKMITLSLSHHHEARAG
jgi:hypothetical protein